MSSEGNPQLLRGPSEEPREDGRDERPEEDVSPSIANTNPQHRFRNLYTPPTLLGSHAAS